LADFTPGDVVVLKCGSMRMMVEAVTEEGVDVIWAHEGQIGRDRVPMFALNKWEDRGPSEHRGPPRPSFGADRDDRPRTPYQGDRKPGGGKPFGAKPPFGGDRGPKPGMDGKPRQKPYFRKDG